MMHTLILHGRKSIQLKKSHNNLVVSLQYLFYSSSANVTPSKDVRKGKTFTASYLASSLGLAKKQAESITKKVSLVDKANADSVLNLFKSHNFTDSQISTMIEAYPQLLITDTEKYLSPNLQLLNSKGALNYELTKILSKVPQILGSKRDKNVTRYYDFVKEIVLGSDNSFHSLAEEGSSSHHQENKLRNLSVLREVGVPHRLLFPLLISTQLMVCGEEKFQESLNKIIEMGFDPTTPKFLRALRIVQKIKWEEKVDVYNKRLGFTLEDVWEMFKKFPHSLTLTENNILNSIETLIALGFSRDDVILMVKRFPSCIGFSTETVKKKTEFLVKKMNWPLESLVSYPCVLGLNMEKRIVPRCNVIKALMSKGLMGKGNKLPSMSAILKYGDKVFLNKYVEKHVGIQPQLMAIFTAGRGS